MKTFPEAPSPSAPASPPVRCLACGHSNSASELSCQACGSSLDLKLCGSCEAINARKAERCHACGQELGEPIVGMVLPALTTYTIDPPRRRGRRALALLAVLVLVLAGVLVLAYRHYGDFFALARQAAVAPSPAQSVQPASLPAAAVEPALPSQAAGQPATKEAPKAIAAKDAPKVAEALRHADARPAARANRAAVSPAHAPSGATAAALPAEEPTKAGPAFVGVSASLPPIPMAHPRVTHTKAMPNDATLPVTGVVASPRTGSNGCSDAVAALGLCGSNEKGEGK